MTGVFKLIVAANGSRTRVEMTTEEVAASIVSVTVSDVNTEAQRRIYDVMPQHKQANTTAQAAVLAAKGSGNWTPWEVDAWNAGLAEYTVITRLRAYSDNLNLMNPIPADYSNDKWWP